MATRGGAADPPHLHRRPQRRPRADHPAGDRPRAWRRIPDPTQQGLLVHRHPRLRAPPGRAEPLPQRLCLLRLRREAARRAHMPRWYKQAFRRMYVVIHGGGTIAEIDARLRAAGLPPLRAGRPRPAEGAGRDRSGAPCPPARRGTQANRPDHFYPGARLHRLGRDRLLLRLRGLEVADRPLQPLPPTSPSRSPSGESRAATTRPSSSGLFTWVRRHPRCQMLVYYQDFGSIRAPTGSRTSRRASPCSRRRLALARPSPAFAPAYPTPPPPPPGGLAP